MTAANVNIATRIENWSPANLVSVMPHPSSSAVRARDISSLTSS